MKNNIQIYLSILCFLLSIKCNSQQKRKAQNISNPVNSRIVIENFLGENVVTPCGRYKKIMSDMKNLRVGEKTRNLNIWESQIKDFKLKLMFQVEIGENDCKQHTLFLNSENDRQNKKDSIKVDWLIGGVGELNASSKISIINDTLRILTTENEKLIDLDNGTKNNRKKKINFILDENGIFKIQHSQTEDEIIYSAEKYYFMDELLTDYLPNYSIIQKIKVKISRQSFLFHLLAKKTKEFDLLVLKADKHGLFNYNGTVSGLGIDLNIYKVSEINGYENGLKIEINKKSELKKMIFYYQYTSEKFSLEKIETIQNSKIVVQKFDQNKYIPIQKIGQYCKEEFSKK